MSYSLYPQGDIDVDNAANTLAAIIRVLSGRPAGLTPPVSPAATAANAVSAQAQSLGGTGQRGIVSEGGNRAITGTFGEGREGHRHAGVDMAVPMGTNILSAAPGVVRQVVNDGQGGGYGNFVMIDHGNGLVTRYAHLTKATVQPGMQVDAGTMIGISGSTGHSTGPHLHFETIKDGTPIDPTPFLAGGFNVIGGEAPPGGDPAPLDPEAIAQSQLADLSTFLEGLKGETGSAQSAEALATPRVATAKATKGAPTATTTSAKGDILGQILAGIGAPESSENRRALEAWAKAEGMNPGANNPFATTWNAPGAQSINSAGVRRYVSQAQGVQATVSTLKQQNFAAIANALRAGTNAMAVADAIASSNWGTGPLVRKILGG